MIKVAVNSVREIGPRDPSGASAYVTGETETVVFVGDAAGAVAALRALPVGQSVTVRHPGGLRSCMNKPSLWPWVEALAGC